MIASVVVAALLLFHPLVPFGWGSALETFLPWLALAVPVLLLTALRRRSWPATAASLLPMLAWLGTFGGQFLPPDDSGDLTVVQHNVSDANDDPAGTARILAATNPDLIGLEEVTTPAYGDALRNAYPYSTVQGTVGLWSRFPLLDAAHLDIKPTGLNADWNRGLRAVARTPHGDVAVYVVHLPSLRPFPFAGLNTTRRDDSARRLGAALKAEPLHNIILIGDLNGTLDDRGLNPVSSQLTGAPCGFALSFPARLPVARIDQVLVRGVTVNRVWSLPKTGSDHLPIAARVQL